MKRVLLFAAILLFAAEASGQELGVEQIVSKANERSYYQGKDGTARVSMAITDAQGRKRQRELTILRLNSGSSQDQKYYVYFYKPNDVKGMSYIAWKHPGKDDDRWLYLPAMDLVRRVAASDKRSSFAGTNFLYEDISGRSTELDSHELIGSDAKYYTVKNTPKDSNQVEFSYYTVKIRKDDFIPEKAEYFDKPGKLYRTVEALEVKDIQGYPTITKMKASDLNSGSSTVSEFSGVKYDIGLGGDIFTERYLRNPPQQWLKE